MPFRHPNISIGGTTMKVASSDEIDDGEDTDTVTSSNFTTASSEEAPSVPTGRQSAIHNAIILGDNETTNNRKRPREESDDPLIISKRKHRVFNVPDDREDEDNDTEEEDEDDDVIIIGVDGKEEKVKSTDDLLKESRTNQNDKMGNVTCPICMEPIEKCVASPCGHFFCADCMYKAMASSKVPGSTKGRCALCRKIVQYKDLVWLKFRYRKKPIDN